MFGRVEWTAYIYDENEAKILSGYIVQASLILGTKHA